MKYRVTIIKGEASYNAFTEDLPGFVGVTGATRSEVIELIKEAIPFHLEGLTDEERAEMARAEKVFIEVQ